MRQFGKGRLLTLLFAGLFMVLTSCGGDGEKEPNEPEDPTDPVEITGLRYVGLWNGNLGFTDVPISAIVEEISPGNFKGDFFISSSFTSCCNSGASDGEITFNVDGTDLKNFRWVDIIPGCTGTFIGSGSVNARGDLRIEITGVDCDGSHIATLTLEKQ